MLTLSPGGKGCSIRLGLQRSRCDNFSWSLLPIPILFKNYRQVSSLIFGNQKEPMQSDSDFFVGASFANVFPMRHPPADSFKLGGSANGTKGRCSCLLWYVGTAVLRGLILIVSKTQGIAGAKPVRPLNAARDFASLLVAYW